MTPETPDVQSHPETERSLALSKKTAPKHPPETPTHNTGSTEQRTPMTAKTKTTTKIRDYSHGVTIRNRNGERVSWSRNLRGICEHARNRIVENICIDHTEDEGGLLRVQWNDNTHVETSFASFSVVVDWVSARDWFQGAKLMIDGTEVTCNRRHVGYPVV